MEILRILEIEELKSLELTIHTPRRSLIFTNFKNKNLSLNSLISEVI